MKTRYLGGKVKRIIVGILTIASLVLTFTVATGSDLTITSGSGFVVSPDGYILTNYHVIQDAAVITVYLKETPYVGDVVAISEASDLALIRIPARNLKAAPLGNSMYLKILEPVVAMGFPLPGFGRELTASTGHLTSIRTDVPGRRGRDTLQHDAVIYRGSSGGPLFNSRGEVIGVNFAAIVGSGFQYAVPINEAIPLLRKIPGFDVSKMGIATEVISAPEIFSRYGETVVYIECLPRGGDSRPSGSTSPGTPSVGHLSQMTINVCLIQSWLLTILDPTHFQDSPTVVPLIKAGWLARDDEGRIVRESGFNIGFGVSFRYYGNQGLQPGRPNWYWGWGTVLLVFPYLEVGLSWKLNPEEGGFVFHLGLWYFYPYLELSIQF
ncbi:MAG: trypsin-like peptidase domain-containing protein [Candidatus Methanomethylicaceae archaeon]